MQCKEFFISQSRLSFNSESEFVFMRLDWSFHSRLLFRMRVNLLLLPFLPPCDVKVCLVFISLTESKRRFDLHSRASTTSDFGFIFLQPRFLNEKINETRFTSCHVMMMEMTRKLCCRLRWENLRLFDR